MSGERPHSDDAVVRRNFALNLFDGAVFGFGMSLVARTTVLPLMIARAGGGNMALGLIPVLWLLGVNVPQVASAARVGRARSLHRFVLGTAAVQRLPWLAMAVLLAFADEIPPPVVTPVLLAAIGLAAVASGVNTPAWFDLVADLTPTRLRGRLFGWRMATAGALGIAGGWIVVRVLARWAWPEGFAILAAGAFGAMVVSYFSLVLLRDDRSRRARSRLRFRDAVRRVPTLLAGSGGFGRFVAADALLVLSTLSAAFLTVAAFERFAITDEDVGWFTMVSAGSGMAGALAFGYLADRFGHRLNLVVAAGASALSCAVAILAPSAALFAVAFAAAALAEGLRNLSRLPFVAELCDERERPSYVAVSNLVVVPLLFLGALAGMLADAGGYTSVFIAAGAIALGALVVLARYVREPRSTHTPEP